MARGFGRHQVFALRARNFVGLGNRASLTTAQGANKDLTFYAKTPGTGGNAITIRYVASGNNTPLSVSVTGSAITVNVSTNGSAAATSTAREIRHALNASPLSSVLIHAQNAYGSDATGVPAAFAATNLAGATSRGAY